MREQVLGVKGDTLSQFPTFESVSNALSREESDGE